MRKFKDSEGVEYEVRQIDTVRKVAILKRISNITEECKRFGVFAFMVGKEITNFISINDAHVMFNHHQTKK